MILPKIKNLIERVNYPEALKKTHGQIIPCSSAKDAREKIESFPTVIAKETKTGALFLLTDKDYNIVKNDGFEKC